MNVHSFDSNKTFGSYSWFPLLVLRANNRILFFLQGVSKTRLGLLHWLCTWHMDNVKSEMSSLSCSLMIIKGAGSIMRVLEELGGPTKKAVAIFLFLQLCLLLLVRLLNDKIQLPLPPAEDAVPLKKGRNAVLSKTVPPKQRRRAGRATHRSSTEV